jgi:uncharacterized membrane protein
MIDAPVERVFAVARDVERFPEIMDDLKSLTVLETLDDGNTTISEWVGVIPDFKMTLKWVQEDRWNPSTYRDDFRALRGDIDELSGWWQFTQEAAGTRFDSVVDYEVNVPLIGPMIKALIKKIMTKNLEATMAAIKASAEAA